MPYSKVQKLIRVSALLNIEKGYDRMNLLTYSTFALFAGIILDFIIGDPHGWYHPVIAIGWLITKTENILRKVFPKTKTGERLAGMLMAVLVIVLSAGIPAVFLILFYRIHPIAGVILESIMCYFLLAAKSLKTESMKVKEALETEGLAAGRKAVSMIVGRDTEQLDETGVIKAAVETVAENTSDGVIAPMLFMALFGGIGGFFYKSVNTMDSMVGYKNERYQYFGTAAARLDDMVNYIPARVSALVMILSCPFCGLDGKGAWRIFRRDRYNHKSPNSAQTEAVMAGALQVQLAGPAWYFGKKHEKPTIGDDIRPVEAADITRSNRLMYVTTVLTAVILLGIKVFVIYKS